MGDRIMKVKQIIKVAEAIDDSRKMPCDMHELEDTKYFSHSKQDFIAIADMDIVHLVRAFKNDRHRLSNQLTDKDLIRQNEDLVSANRQLARQHDIWKEKAMNMVEKSTHEDKLKETISTYNTYLANSMPLESFKKINNQCEELQLENQRLVQRLEHDETVVSKESYQVKIKQNMRMWDNCQKLKKEVAHYKKLAEDNFIQSVDDSETSESYEKEVEYWKAQYRIANDLLKPKGCGYMFSEIPNDTDGQEFVDTMKKYFNKNTYSMRVRGQHIKPELRGTGATYFGQNLNESTHMRIYITNK